MMSEKSRRSVAHACLLNSHLTYHSPNLDRDVDFDLLAMLQIKTHVIGNLRVGLVAGNLDEGELAVLLLSAKSGGAGGLSGEEGDGDGLDDGHGCLALLGGCFC